MKGRKVIVACILLFLLSGGMTACGSQTSPSADQQASGQQSTAQVEAQTQGPAIDRTASADGLLGKWQNISSTDQFATITKTDTGYQYEDNDGKYPADFRDGVLKVQVSADNTADVYIDSKSGHMFAEYQGDATEFQKQ